MVTGKPCMQDLHSTKSSLLWILDSTEPVYGNHRWHHLSALNLQFHVPVYRINNSGPINIYSTNSITNTANSMKGKCIILRITDPMLLGNMCCTLYPEPLKYNVIISLDLTACNYVGNHTPFRTSYHTHCSNNMFTCAWLYWLPRMSSFHKTSYPPMLSSCLSYPPILTITSSCLPNFLHGGNLRKNMS